MKYPDFEILDTLIFYAYKPKSPEDHPPLVKLPIVWCGKRGKPVVMWRGGEFTPAPELVRGVRRSGLPVTAFKWIYSRKAAIQFLRKKGTYVVVECGIFGRMVEVKKTSFVQELLNVQEGPDYFQRYEGKSASLYVVGDKLIVPLGVG